jgi:FkbM family methyltransferase
MVLPNIICRVAQKLQGYCDKALGIGWVAGIDKEVKMICDCDKRLNSENNNLVIFDVGANRGDWADAIIDKFPSSALYLVEPSNENILHLKSKFSEMFIHNDLSINQSVFNGIHLVPFALGCENSEGLLYADESGSGLASLTKRKLQHYNIDHGRYCEHVTIRTLDEIISCFQIDHINLIKIDVEGHEIDVLRGGEQAFKNNMIGCVQFEYGGCNIDTKVFFQDLWNFFNDYKFCIYRMTPFGLYKLGFYSELLEKPMYSNLIALNQH